MKKELLKIENIPAILWGEKSDKIYLCVHGKMSSKEAAKGFAEIATQRGYQVISFDLPEHGDRKNEDYACNVWNGVRDLNIISNYIQQNWSDMSLYASSLGAYFSLLAYKELPLSKCLFLSPILDMRHLIENMMKWSNVSPEMLREKQEINTTMGETLYWDYYSYVKEHPIEKWIVPTAILYGAEDNLTEREIVDDFTRNFSCHLTVMQGSEHWFHTQEQLTFLEQWLDKCI